MGCSFRFIRTTSSLEFTTQLRGISSSDYPLLLASILAEVNPHLSKLEKKNLNLQYIYRSYDKYDLIVTSVTYMYMLFTEHCKYVRHE